MKKIYLAAFLLFVLTLILGSPRPAHSQSLAPICEQVRCRATIGKIQRIS